MWGQIHFDAIAYIERWQDCIERIRADYTPADKPKLSALVQNFKDTFPDMPPDVIWAIAHRKAVINADPINPSTVHVEILQ